jgi:hypothetical protein
MNTSLFGLFRISTDLRYSVAPKTSARLLKSGACPSQDIILPTDRAEKRYLDKEFAFGNPHAGEIHRNSA